MAGVPIERVIERLFPAGDDESTYAILDGARSPGIFPLITTSRLASRCLYVGAIAPELARVAPHLVRLSLAEPSTRALITQGWGESWGIFLRAHAPMGDLHRHLRRFLRVQDERGRKLLFRYYDPRVMRLYLPTCSAAELAQVFGPVDMYLLEGHEPERILEFRRGGGALAASEVRIEKRLAWLGDYLRKNRETDA